MLNGQPVKELANGVVKLPFDCEYSLRFRNKNNRKAVVQIYIDGENVSGGGYVIPANDFIDIKRHHDVDRSFKFVSLDSAEAIEHGKNGPNDDKVKGTIEARFYLEKEPVYNPPIVIEKHHYHDCYPKPDPYYPNPWKQPYYPIPYGPIWSTTSGTYENNTSETNPNVTYSCNSTGGMKLSSMGLNSINCCVPPIINEVSPLQDGCTVEGVSTGQNFYSTYINTEEHYTSVKIFLQGYKFETQNAPAANIGTTYCINCGAKKKKSANFCHKCGVKL
jgi:ribosomal protein L40E